MTLLMAISAALRVLIMVLFVAMLIGLRRELWCVIVRCPGWKVHLSSFVFTVMVGGGAVISSVAIFGDLGLPISQHLRFAVADVGLAMFVVATLTGLYRRALRAGPEKARAALLSGLALIVPFAGLVALLALRGAHV